MRSKTIFHVGFLVFVISALTTLALIGRAQKSGTPTQPTIPKTWNDEAMATLEVPLADQRGSPKHISAAYYYKIPVRPIYKQYPIYAPGHEPPGYFDRLRQQEPEIIWGEDKNGQKHAPPLNTESDWIKAGEIVFDAPLDLMPVTDKDLRDLWFYEKIGLPLAERGMAPFDQLVIREKGTIELGNNSCRTCHTRVMPDGTIIKGAQGNFPMDRFGALTFHRYGSVELFREFERALFAAPWLRSDPQARLQQMSLEEISSVHEAIPPGVIARQRSSPFYPVHVPDLIGVKDRHYLDSTGLQQHRSIVDLMRYVALNQSADMLSSFDGFIPGARYPRPFPDFKKLPDPDKVGGRYSDEQLYALVLFVYSLQPPPNPNKFDAVAAHGQKVFQREGCGMCHSPPLYTNNKLTPAEGFKVPEDHLKKYEILPVSVGTDPNLTMNTRRGTGYYKVPPLTGVWYRSMFGHSGWCATLEDWFDPRRLGNDYVPTGFKGYGAKTRAVKGHEFGLKLSEQDKTALIAFLKTL